MKKSAKSQFGFEVLMTALTIIFGCLGGFLLVSVAEPIAEQVYMQHLGKSSTYRMNIFLTETDELLGFGTGFVTRDGSGNLRMVTNSHVCVTWDSRTTLKLNDGRILKKVSFDQMADLCTLEIPQTNLKESPLALAGSASTAGDQVWVYGYPLGGSGSLVYGMVGNDVENVFPIGYKGQEAPNTKCLQNENPLTQIFCFIARTDTYIHSKIYPGNSGSPVLNHFGHVVGVIWGYDRENNAGVAVTYKSLRRILNFVEPEVK